MLRDYCLSLPHTTEDMPFDQDVLAFRVHGKIYALTSTSKNESVNLKCEPKESLHLREQYSAVSPGYHMNKLHWNTVYFNSDLNDQEILDMVKVSYDLIFAALPKKLRETSTREK